MHEVSASHRSASEIALSLCGSVVVKLRTVGGQSRLPDLAPIGFADSTAGLTFRSLYKFFGPVFATGTAGDNA